jgi:response regulator NasT
MAPREGGSCVFRLGASPNLSDAWEMRLLLVDPDPARAALVAEGLAGMRPLELRRTSSLNETELAEFKPDLIIVACDSPDRDTLESLREATHGNPRPVVMFVDRSEPGLAEEAVRAGVAAYIVDGLQPGRVRSILEVAMSRFQLMQQLRADLAKAQSDLASRKTVERAKGLLMKERQVGEEEAYAMLRKLAMNSGRSVSAIAADLLSFHGVLKGDKS